MPFNAKEHLRHFERRQKQPDGSYKQVSVPYLDVAWRVVWFREEHPKGRIETELLSDPAADFAVVKATVTTEDGVSATGHGRIHKDDWDRFLEKAETAAIGRALEMLGYGTEFSGDAGDEALVETTTERPRPEAARQTSRLAASDGATRDKHSGNPELDAPLSEEAAGALVELSKTAKIGSDEFIGILKGRYSVARMGELTVGQGRDLGDYLRQRMEGRRA